MAGRRDNASRVESTISLSGSPGIARDQGVIPTLTVLFHPVPQRIGGVAQFERRIHLSRIEPLFDQPDGGSAPLADPVLSRRPVVIEELPAGSFAIRPEPGRSSVRLDGQPIHEPVVLGLINLQRGVVIELGDRVVLLWHLAEPRRAPGPSLGLVGANDAIETLRQDILRVAMRPAPVLIRGESGVGKELVARAIHEAGPRRDQPLVSVNMGAVPPSTAVSELFGHVRGAFTGAAKAHDGYFVQASGGTLFLDEIGEATAEVQSMLLRAIETGEIRPLGARGDCHVDVHVITATDTDLGRAVEAGLFRLPLLHRLAGIEMVVPPLRSRRDDIGRLLVHFLAQELAENGEERRLEPPSEPGAPTWLPPALVARLACYHWPGNVRQLRNLARQIAVANYGMPSFRTPPALADLWAAPAAEAPMPPPQADTDSGRLKRLDIAEDDLHAALQAHQWRPGPTAAALGISRASLYKLMNRSPQIRMARELAREEIIASAARCNGDLDAMAEDLKVSRRSLQIRMTELGLNEPGMLD
jgi:two-component system nitrogen regulation response regulator GlnG